MTTTEPADPLRAELEREFGPQWELFTGIAGLRYGRLRLSSPPVVFRGEDWLDLRDQIRGHLGRTEPV